MQALYTDDGIWAPTGKMFGLDHGDDSHFGTLGVDGSELRRTATLHAGELDIFRAVQVGDRAVAFGWRWSDFASGTGVLHLRDGKIAVASLAVTEAEISLAP